MFARAMQSDAHPILAQVVPTRRCNLDCGYCNEYDKTSDPVPLGTMLRRIDRLAELGTTIITLSGGEPMPHPDLDAIIARIRGRGAIATLITNGLLLTTARASTVCRSASTTHARTRFRRKACRCWIASWSGWRSMPSSA
jgi:MoaA/NifB/PqqE/SkfB family radical SAM enzyme